MELGYEYIREWMLMIIGEAFDQCYLLYSHQQHIIPALKLLFS